MPNILQLILAQRQKANFKLELYVNRAKLNPNAQTGLAMDLADTLENEAALWRILAELKEQHLENAEINMKGKCYGCGIHFRKDNTEWTPIVIYQSSRNQTVSLFHKNPCWLSANNVAGGNPPVAEILV